MSEQPHTEPSELAMKIAACAISTPSTVEPDVLAGRIDAAGLTAVLTQSDANKLLVDQLRAQVQYLARERIRFLSILPRCKAHDSCLLDGGGEILAPPCGCRWPMAQEAQR